MDRGPTVRSRYPTGRECARAIPGRPDASTQSGSATIGRSRMSGTCTTREWLPGVITPWSWRTWPWGEPEAVWSSTSATLPATACTSSTSLSSRAAAVTRSSATSFRSTRAPRRAKRSAIALPIPLPAPMMDPHHLPELEGPTKPGQPPQQRLPPPARWHLEAISPPAGAGMHTYLSRQARPRARRHTGSAILPIAAPTDECPISRAPNGKCA